MRTFSTTTVVENFASDSQGRRMYQHTSSAASAAPGAQRRRVGLVRRLGLVAVCATVVAGVGAVSTATVSAAALSTRQAQWNLAGLAYLRYSGIDGVVGPTTRGAAKAFQIHQCMDADGSIGPLTSARLVAMIQAVQRKVGVTADGLNGPNTKAAIIAYQRRNGLVADGEAGPATFAKMGLARTRPCGGPIVGSIYADSSAVACAAGTTNLGVHYAYSRGTRIRARLCAIPGMRSTSSESTPGSAYYIAGANGNTVVNARVSNAVLGIFTAGRNSGLTLRTVSGFRSMAHQQALCNANSLCRNGNYTYVARPGYSNHQLGVAIDFAGTNVKGAASCTSGRAKDPGSVTWSFLERNARRFGYRQYAAESWHWDPMVSTTRC